MFRYLFITIVTVSLDNARTQQLGQTGNPGTDTAGFSGLDSQTKALNCSLPETNLNTFFDMFRAPQQHAEFEQQFYEMRNQPEPEVQNPTSQCVDRCFSNPLKGPLPSGPQVSEVDLGQCRTTRPGRRINHCNCVSQPFFICPNTAVTCMGNITVTLPQFPKMQQYFPTETCSNTTTIYNCYNSKCQQELTCMPAVGVNSAARTCPEYYKIYHIQVPGCCKCVNNALH